jgi:septum formation protein
MHLSEEHVTYPPTQKETAPDTRLILASASPRRRALLALLGIPFHVVPSDAEERDDPVPSELVAMLPPWPLPLQHHPTLLAWRKARAIWEAYPTDVVLGADTTVVLGDEVLNKPCDASHAREMLTHLSGQTHTVYTGLCVCTGQTSFLDLVASHVTFFPLQTDQIDSYIATGEPMDKAGAYGIQDKGGQLVQHVAGSYTAVIGLPLPATHNLLTAAGIHPLNDPTDAYHTWLRNQRKEPMPCPPTLP